MGVSWTEDQQQVIDLRGSNILVAAAAGSGKTAVLVERIITRLTKDENPLNVDELVIVTFTEAAAAEMKERILAAIEKALAEDLNNQHLQKQATLIHNASITTIHSFCLSVIRDHFHTIQLDPVFRIGEEGELKLLKQEVIGNLLEEEYADRREAFIDFVECVAPGKSDKKVEELILELYNFSRSYPQPNQWLDSCIDSYDVPSETALEQSEMVNLILQDVKHTLSDMQEQLEKAIELSENPGGPHHYLEALFCDRVELEELAKATTFGELSKKVRNLEWAPLSRKRPKDVDPDRKAAVQFLRDTNKAIVKEWMKLYFYTTAQRQQRDIFERKQIVEELVRLVKKYSENYFEEKKSRGMIDFNDMEHLALAILTDEVDGKLVPSKVAKEYQDKFAEVMIDEYQDSNLIQESILTSVSRVSRGEYNVFMVGDVKQSIYRFRLSRPELFMEKFNTYSIGSGQERRIDLSKNFRSRSEVLDSTNHIFYQIMKSYLGGVEYDEKAALYCGAAFEQMPNNHTEILLLDSKSIKEDEKLEGTTREMEARTVARRIKELVGNHQVFDKNIDGYRPAKYSDIVLLTRSLAGWSDLFAEILAQEGVPTSVASREGYFSTWEISLLLDYLRVIDNPKQDIPLTAVLRSMFGKCTDSELAMIKGNHRNYTFYDAVYAYLKEDHTNEDGIKLQKKLQSCFARIEEFRDKVSYMAINELLWDILQVTNFGSYVQAMPGGTQRKANVDMLLEKATTFEGTSYKGVFNFIRYIEQLQKYQVEYGEASVTDELDDAVRIMSIHKSKGLEFPIVFVIGMGKMFNKQDLRGLIATHPEIGIGIDAISPQKRTKRTVLLKQIIKRKLDLDSLGEELRVLYVAMTRAKEKLILIGDVRDWEKKKEVLEIQQFSKAKSRSFLELSHGKTYFDWILPCVYNLQERVPIIITEIDLGTLAIQEQLEELVACDHVSHLLNDASGETGSTEMKEYLDTQFSYEYAYKHEQEIKLKMTVTEIKKRAQLQEESGDLLIEKDVRNVSYSPFIQVVPEFLKKEKEVNLAVFRGNAYHRLMEIWEFDVELKEEIVSKEINKLTKFNRISEEMADAIDIATLLGFLKSEIGQRMQRAKAQGLLRREQPFVLGIPATDIFQIEEAKPSCKETVLVQGIIDAYFEEDNEITLIDYKTDQVKTAQELVTRYEEQLTYYGRALEQLTGKTVKEKLIYSFSLQEFINV